MGKRWCPPARAVASRAGCGERGWSSPEGYRSCCSHSSSRINAKVAVNMELHRVWVALGQKRHAFFPGLFPHK